MKSRTVFLALFLVGASVQAATGPERFLSGLAASRMTWSFAFDGKDYVAIWRESAGVFTARIDEQGDPVSGPTLLASGDASPVGLPLAIAADHGTTLLAWLDRSSTNFRVSYRWLGAGDERAHLAGSFALNQDPADLGVDAAFAGGKFVLAWRSSYQSIDVASIDPGSGQPVQPVSLAVPFSGGVVLGSNRADLLLVWGRVINIPCSIPEGCFVRQANAERVDPASLLRTDASVIDPGYEIPRFVRSTPSGEFVTSFGVDYSDSSVVLLSRQGGVLDRRLFPFLGWPDVAFLDQSAFVTVRSVQNYPVGDLFVGRLDGISSTEPPELIRMHTSTMVSRSQLVAGTRSLLVSYELVGPAGQRGLAYQIVDPTSSPILPSKPLAPSSGSSVPGTAARVTISWQPVAGAARYRVQGEALERFGGRFEQVVEGSGASSTVVALYPDYNYSIRVVAESDEGRSAPSEPLAVRAPAFGTPRVPQTVSAIRHADGTVTVSWVDTSSNEDGFRITGHPISGPIVLLADVPANTHQVTISVPSDVHELTILAYNVTGVSSVAFFEVTPARSRPVRRRS